jgi:hypothetical protein
MKKGESQREDSSASEENRQIQGHGSFPIDAVTYQWQTPRAHLTGSYPGSSTNRPAQQGLSCRGPATFSHLPNLPNIDFLPTCNNGSTAFPGTHAFRVAFVRCNWKERLRGWLDGEVRGENLVRCTARIFSNSHGVHSSAFL